MAKGFSKNNPLERLSGTNDKNEIQKEPSVIIEPEAEQEKPPVKQKRKVGRPKTKDIKNTCKNINVAVPITLLDKWENIKNVHGNNLTEYITRLIEKDMNANYDHYKKISDSIKNM